MSQGMHSAAAERRRAWGRGLLVGAWALLAAYGMISVVKRNAGGSARASAPSRTATSPRELGSSPRDSRDLGSRDRGSVAVVEDVTPVPGRDRRRGGTLELVQDLEPATDAGRFDLLVDGKVVRDEAVAVASGDHRVRVRAEAGTDLTDYDSALACTGDGNASVARESGSGPLTVRVSHSDEVVCTITTRRKATVTVRNVTQPAQPGGPTFAFTSTLPAASSFRLTHGAERAVAVAPGDYSVTEADPEEQRHRLSEAACTERFGASRGTGATTAFTADPGDEIVCTYENARIDRAIQVRETGPSLAYAGDAVTFTSGVTNTGNDPLTSIAVRDDRCDATAGATARTGANQDGTLDPGETWGYSCSYVATHAMGDDNPVTATLTATGRDSDGGTVKDADRHDTRFLHPAIDLETAQPATATAGDLVTFSMTVTTSGDSPLADPLDLAATRCLAAPVLRSKAGDQTPGTLEAGDVWSYACQVQTSAGQTEVINTATVTGTDEHGGLVTDEDTLATTLTEPAARLMVETVAEPLAVDPGAEAQPRRRARPWIVVAPTAVVAETARARDTKGCPRRTIAAAGGRRIVRVTWYLDGERIALRTQADGDDRWTVPVEPRTQRDREQHLTARVRFAASSTSATGKTLRVDFGFGRCRPGPRRPTSTG